MIKGAQNPQAMLSQIANSNPMVQQAMQIMQQCGGDPNRAIDMICQQRGINPNEARQLIKQYLG